MIEFSLIKDTISNADFSSALEKLASHSQLEVTKAAQVWNRISVGINTKMMGVGYLNTPEDVNFFAVGTAASIVLGYLAQIQSGSINNTDIIAYYGIRGAVSGIIVDALEQQTNSCALDLMTFLPRLFNLLVNLFN